MPAAVSPLLHTPSCCGAYLSIRTTLLLLLLLDKCQIGEIGKFSVCFCSIVSVHLRTYLSFSMLCDWNMLWYTVLCVQRIFGPLGKRLSFNSVLWRVQHFWNMYTFYKIGIYQTSRCVLCNDPDDVMGSEHLLHCPTLNHEAQQTKDLVSLYWKATEKMT
jgi:hypothetical protein